MAAPTSTDGTEIGVILLVIHDFVARSEDELSLAKGDRIELIESDAEFGDSWYLGRHMGNGRTGLFPEVYTTPAPRGTLHSSRHVSDGPRMPQNNGSLASAAAQMRHSAGNAMGSSSNGSQLSPGDMAQTAALRAAGGGAGNSTSASRTQQSDSPVMNETLSVIDEHITDMHTPRSSYANGNKRDTVSSVYSTQPISRMSYIPGHETDEDENQNYTDDEVMAWTPEQVAEYLEDHGVEKLHCDVFKEQEISGEVLLAMDQSSLFIKEFSLGAVGRRLKTWHKIKALQDEVRQGRSPGTARTNSQYSDHQEETGSRNRSSTIGTILPRALETSRQGAVPGRSDTVPVSSPVPESEPETESIPSSSRGPSVVSPLQSMTSLSKPDNAYRPSAQAIRMTQSRRHSSIDSTSDAGTRQTHRKIPSIDSKWQPGQPVTGSPSHSHTLSSDATASSYRDSTILVPSSPSELDRGYFSSNEVETRSRSKKLNLVTKSPSTSTTSSARPTRANSFVNSSTWKPASSYSPSKVFGLLGSTRSATSPTLGKASTVESSTPSSLEVKPMKATQSPASPVVTMLSYNDNFSVEAVAASQTAVANQAVRAKSSKRYPGSENWGVNNTTPSPSGNHFNLLNKAKFSSMRISSDAVTKNEKSAASAVDTTPSSKEDTSSPARTGSTTPSTETQSFDIPKSDSQSRTSTGSGSKLMPPSASLRRPRARTKKSTSAYTRGLEKKKPAESMASCDYSGWMKKKSGSLMSTWKTRLFILRGRRLSYYYKEDDVEEKGLIDISFHRVLPAHNETLTGLHAAMTGAGANPSSPKEGSARTAAQEDLEAHPGKDGDEGLFIFKLVPPKAGLSKAVNFTKPTVHYFAVSSRQEGRLWMAALMKATIDRDDRDAVTTTYNQKTISLAKARERQERPPALKEEPTVKLDAEEMSGLPGSGLGITDVVNDREAADIPTVGGAEELSEKEKLALSDRTTTSFLSLSTTDGVTSEKMEEYNAQ